LTLLTVRSQVLFSLFCVFDASGSLKDFNLSAQPFDSIRRGSAFTMLFQYFSLLPLLSITLAAPLQSNDEDAGLEERQLTYSTPGINFNYVTQECNPDQQAILKQVAISTQDFLADAVYGWERGWAWSQYFLDVNPFGPNKNQGWKVIHPTEEMHRASSWYNCSHSIAARSPKRCPVWEYSK